MVFRFTSRDITQTQSGTQTPLGPDLLPPRGVRARQGQDRTSRGEESQRAADDEGVEMLLVRLTAQSDAGCIVDPGSLHLASRRTQNKKNCSDLPRYPRLCQTPQHHSSLHLQCGRGQSQHQPGPAPGDSPGGGGHPRHLHLAGLWHC